MRDASLTGWVIDVTESDFETDIIERSRLMPVIVDFWAEWCEPCRTLGPILEKLVKEKAGVFVLAKINVEEAQQLAGAFGIESIPAVRVIKDGELVNGFNGLLPAAQIVEFLDQIVPSESENLMKAMAEKETTNPKEAEAFYRKLILEDPGHEHALVSLARTLVHQHKDEEAQQILGKLGVVGEVGAEAERLRRIIDVRKEGGASGGDESALRKKVAAEPENAKARYELGSLLAKQERYPEALEMLLSAAELDRELGRNEVRELMVKIWEIIGIRSDLADATRDKLRSLLY
jgi:putative thioredoxin